MPKYLCVQRPLPGNKGQKPSPSEMQEMYAKFGAWKESFRENLVDLGGKLGAGRLITAAPTTDGPFIEVKDLIGGYMIVSANSLDAAAAIAAACPGLVGTGSGVEVIEIHTP